MGPRKEGVASTLPIANGKARKRLVREHGFIGGHVEGMWPNALQVEARKNQNALEVVLINPQPHALPSGFGSREILIEAQYLSKGKAIKNEIVSLSAHYVNKRGKPTIPHLAAKTVQSIAIPANGSKAFALPMAAGADQVVVSVSYRLVNDEVRQMLDLKDPIWSKKMVIKKVNLKL